MASIARVAVDIGLDREFDYEVPERLEADVSLGSRVVVPFGRTEKTGVVVGLVDRSDRADLKPLTSVLGDKPFVDGPMLELARWLADYYCAPFELALRTVLPGAVRRLGAGFKTRLYVSVVGLDPGDPSLETPKLPAKQAAVLDRVRTMGGCLLAELTNELGLTAAPVHALAKKGLVSIAPMPMARLPLADRRILPTQPLTLMPEQAEALVAIRGAVEDSAPSVVLVYGVTGSGKTEVYLQAIDHVLQRGQGAIVLVPEISLTPQTIERFVGRFGDRIAVLHSHLSDGERHDEWHRIRNGDADIVVGARSAVFAPVKRLGLIVVDEEHEPSYKQEDSPPRYHARDVAVMRGRMHGCAVVLGSATPSLESWANAGKGKYGLAILPRRADHRQMPVVHVVDMRAEAARTGKSGVFSQSLLEAIRLRLDRVEQTILFLNRRGYATSLICPNCGFVANCDQCSVTYTYHRSANELRCHICGGTRKVPPRCPGCQDPAFRYAGVGTQRIERIVATCFPGARVQRMDADITTRKDAYERILGDFRAGKIDILIGTQMIAKGLHFPNVTLVGVVYADLSLHMPDFRAGERTFQLLAQVAGRAGRGDVAGEVIVQTYTPFHSAVQAARRADFEGFSDQELAFREELGYPPFSRLVCVTLKGPSEAKVSATASALAGVLKPVLADDVILTGPSPAVLAKAKGQYRYQLMLRCPSVRRMTTPLKEGLRGLKLPRGVACSVDVDAISLF